MGLIFVFSLTTVKTVFAKFEVLQNSQLHVGCAAFLVTSNDLVYTYCSSPNDLGEFVINKECFEVAKSLSSNTDILITKPGMRLVLSSSAKQMTLTKWNGTKVLCLISCKDSSTKLKLDTVLIIKLQ